MRTLGFLLLACAMAAGDTVVLRDRTVVEGDVTKGNEALRVGDRSIPLDEVLLWENGEGLVRYAVTARDHYRGCAVLANRSVRKDCEAGLAKAIAADDGGTAKRLLDRAERAGLDAAQAEMWDRKIDAAGDGKSGVKVPGDGALVDLLLDRSRKHMEDNPRRAYYLLRAALRLDGNHSDAVDYLDERAPRRWRLGDDRNWLDWKLAVLHQVRLLKSVRGRGSPDVARAIVYWGRKDIVGLETPNLILITPLPNPDPIQVCLELGDLTCAALDKMFGIEQPKRNEFLPLIVYFYENRDEYIKLGKGGRPNPTLALTAGFYTPSENVSRFFWPKGSARQSDVHNTFVHELTHHWIERRNPRWHERDLATGGERVETPGYWVVEGFATFIEASRFDRVRKTWTHFNPHATSIDIVASVAKSGKLLDWERVYTLTQAKFHGELTKTAAKLHCMVKPRWRFRPHGINEIRLFYEQASATCAFLYHAEGGKYREALLTYVTSFYTSKKDRTDVNTAFDLSPKALGDKVAKWCTDVIYNGWKP